MSVAGNTATQFCDQTKTRKYKQNRQHLRAISSATFFPYCPTSPRSLLPTAPCGMRKNAYIIREVKINKQTRQNNTQWRTLSCDVPPTMVIVKQDDWRRENSMLDVGQGKMGQRKKKNSHKKLTTKTNQYRIIKQSLTLINYLQSLGLLLSPHHDALL